MIAYSNAVWKFFAFGTYFGRECSRSRLQKSLPQFFIRPAATLALRRHKQSAKCPLKQVDNTTG